MSFPLTMSIMPSESSFKRQADLAREALKSFSAVKSIKSPIIVNAALKDLLDNTVAFNNFVPYFVSHALFQELVPAVHTVINEFSTQNPSFDMPPSAIKVSGLLARVKDSMGLSNSKKGVFFNPFSSFCSLILFARRFS